MATAVTYKWEGTLPDGTVVHLSNGFRQFVRCRVETGEYEEGLSGKTSTGKHVVAIAHPFRAHLKEGR